MCLPIYNCLFFEKWRTNAQVVVRLNNYLRVNYDRRQETLWPELLAGTLWLHFFRQLHCLDLLFVLKTMDCRRRKKVSSCSQFRVFLLVLGTRSKHRKFTVDTLYPVIKIDKVRVRVRLHVRSGVCTIILALFERNVVDAGCDDTSPIKIHSILQIQVR